MTLVLAASVTMSWLLGDARAADHGYALAVLSTLKNPQTEAQVPEVWSLEVANVIARAEAKHLVTEAQSNAFLEMLTALGVHTDVTTHSRALDEVLDLARRFGLSSYDAAYLELALRLSLPLATLDADLARAAKRAGVKRFTPD